MEDLKKEVLDCLTNIGENEIRYFDDLTSTLTNIEDECFEQKCLAEIGRIKKLSGCDDDQLNLMCIYFLGFDMGINDGVRLEREANGVANEN